MLSKKKSKRSKDESRIKKQMKKGPDLMGDLAKSHTPEEERINKLRMKLDADERNRITIKQTQPTLDKKGKPVKQTRRNKKNKGEYKSKKNEEVLKEEYEKNYVWVRRELEGYAPLRTLDVWNKVRTSIKYMDEKKGKTARKLAEAARLQNMRRIKIEAEMKKKITDFTDDILEDKAISQELEINCKPEHVDILKTVINQEYFTMFNVSLVETNSNLKRYGINPPILINITKKDVR